MATLVNSSFECLQSLIKEVGNGSRGFGSKPLIKKYIFSLGMESFGDDEFYPSIFKNIVEFANYCPNAFKRYKSFMLGAIDFMETIGDYTKSGYSEDYSKNAKILFKIMLAAIETNEVHIIRYVSTHLKEKDNYEGKDITPCRDKEDCAKILIDINSSLTLFECNDKGVVSLKRSDLLEEYLQEMNVRDDFLFHKLPEVVKEGLMGEGPE